MTYRNAFVTSIEVTEDNVAEVVTCGRTRWKIENESFNVLKNHGYNLAHNFGHGSEHLAKIFATMNLLAFCFHSVCDLTEELWKQARLKAGKRTSFFDHLTFVCSYHVFANWESLLTTLVTRNLPERERLPGIP